MSNQLERVVTKAVEFASQREHPEVTLEHLLYALLREDRIQEIVSACGGKVTKFQKDVEEYFNNFKDKSEEINNPLMKLPPIPSVGIQRVVRRAQHQIQSSGRSEKDGSAEDLLVALFYETDSAALYLIRKNGLTKQKVLEYISHGVKETEGEVGKENLDKYAIDLCERAKQGKIDPLIGREQEIERIVQVLCRKKKNNPIIVGEAGVGKTALAEGLALRIANNDVPKILKGSKVYSIDMGSMLAGSKFRGDFEERLKGVIKELQAIENSIVFIDEIHNLIGAGSTSGSTMDASNLLKPALTSGDLRCIGATTYKEFREHFENDGALARRFQKIDLLEPSIEETVQIIEGLKDSYERHHNVEYTDKAIRFAAELSAKHINDRKLPDKAIDIIDEAGARAALRRENEEVVIINEDDIQYIISKIAKVPIQKVSSDEETALANLEKHLNQTVFGQDHAIEQLVTAIQMSRAGLREPNKPIGNFLFTGPTGTGKTELVRQLSQVMGIELLRFDMSEYMESHTVARLIGSPPGYVGFNQGGLLTEKVYKNPHAVLLLDEIEKAHPDIQNVLLQVMDNGQLTDTNGRTVDFRNVILVMTSNAGAREMSKTPLGFGADQKTITQGKNQAVMKIFSPEFRNRLDATINFNSLDPIVMGSIVDKFIKEMNTQLKDKNVTVILTPKAREYLAQEGYEPAYGARPLGRVIQEQIKKPLSNEILFGKLKKGGKLKIGCKKGQLEFMIENEKVDGYQLENVN